MSPTWFRRSLAAAAIATIATIAGMATLVGCSAKGALTPNAEPETNVFVQFDATDTLDHTVNHEVHLYWFGSDVDGFVTAYDIRFVDPGGPADPPWTRTPESDSLFTVQVPTGAATPTFQVRAVDNDGAVDASPAQQQFSLENAAPILVLLDPPRSTDTTFATQSVAWSAIDPDGDASRIVYRVWLDGNEANPHVMMDRFFTFPSADFLRNGHYTAGPRTVFVQAFDAGGRASNLQSATWVTRTPLADSTRLRGRLLLIDNVPTTNSANNPTDNVYNQAVIRNLAIGESAVLRLQTNRPFRSSADLLQSLSLYDAVVWYRGNDDFDSARDTLLVRHSDAVADYIRAGGRLYFEAMDMIAGGIPGILSQDFLRTVLDCDSLHRFVEQGELREAWGASNSTVLRSPPYVYNDSLRATAILRDMRGFAPKDTHNVVLRARPNSLTQPDSVGIPLAIRAHAGGSTGTMIVVTMPMVAMNGFTSVPRFLDRIFAELTNGTSPGLARSTWRSMSQNRQLQNRRPRR